jgi:hypothetical protein
VSNVYPPLAWPKMSITPAAELARLRAHFPDWRLARSRAGVFLACHRVAGARLDGRTVADLEAQLREWAWGRARTDLLPSPSACSLRRPLAVVRARRTLSRSSWPGL